MTRKLVTVSTEDSVETAVRHLQQRGIRHLLVLQAGELVGILSDRDLKRAIDPQNRKKRKLLNLGGLFFLLEPIMVREIMTKDPITIGPGAKVQDAAAIMVEQRIGALPVVRDGEIVGILTESDVLRCFVQGEKKPASKKSSGK
jgi:acetoin utilization protein AcuB